MWVKLDDSFFEHRKVVAVTPIARLLFLASLAHSAKHLADGVVAEGYLPNIRASAGATRRHMAELVSVGLWETHPSGYLIHDWSDYNPPAEKVRAKRAAAKERMNALRSREQDGTVQGEQDGEQDASVQDEQTHAVHARTRAIPVSRNPLPVAPAGGAATSPILALLSKNFENELGELSVSVGDELRDWSERIPANGRGEKCVEYAFREAAAQSHRSWSYVAAILSRLEGEGWPAEPETVAPPSKAEAEFLEQRYRRGKATADPVVDPAVVRRVR